MTIRLYYFALLRDQRGVAEEQLFVESKTVGQLYDFLREQYGFSLEKPSLRVSVNQAFVPWNTLLADGDEVVFIPPVSGG